MVMARIARDCRLAAIVVPRPQRGLRKLLRRALGRSQNPLERLGASIIDATEVERFRPEVIVVASFPTILPAATLAAASIGALNLHMSLLPRHRGVDPIFSTYWANDRSAGMTIHWMNDNIDAGDIAAQKATPLPRGQPSRELYMHLSALGTEMIADLLGRIASGHAPRRPQDASRATYISAADIARARVPFAQWPAERVWHVLSGLGDQRSWLVADAEGRPLAHGRATGFRVTGEVEPGRVTMGAAGYELHCRDGLVAVERHS